MKITLIKFFSLRLNQIFSIISTVFPNILLLILGNYFSFDDKNYYSQSMSLMFIYLLTGNWMGLQDFLLLGRLDKQSVVKRFFIDGISIFLCSMLFIFIIDDTSIDTVLLPFISIISYVLFFLVGLIRTNGRYFFSAVIMVSLSPLITYAWFVSSISLLFIVLIIEFILIYILLFYNNNLISDNANQNLFSSHNLVLYFSAFVSAILFGEIDKYILSIAKSSELGFYYSTLNFIITLPLLFYVCSMSYLVNYYKKNGFVSGINTLHFSLYIFLFISLIYSFFFEEGQYFDIEGILMIATIFFKVFAAANMMPYVVTLYACDKYRAIVLYNYVIGLIQLTISLFLFFSFSPYIIISIGKVLSGITIIVYLSYFKKYLQRSLGITVN